MSSKTLLPHPKPGALGDYSTKSSERSRHAELNKSVHKHGYKSTILDLNLRATLNKNQAPDAAKVMHEDMDYLREKYRGMTPKSKKGGKSRKSKKSRKSHKGGKSRKSRVGRSRKGGSRRGGKSRKSRAGKSRKSRKSRK